MSYYRDEIYEVAHKLNVNMSELSEDAQRSLREKLVTKFSDSECYYMWKCLKERESIQIEEPWTWLKEFTATIPTVLLFDRSEDNMALVFKTGIDAVSVLEECFRMEFYLTDMQATFLLCCNHHNYLIASGTALNWLRKKIEVVSSK